MGVHVMSGDMFNVWMPSAFAVDTFDQDYDRFRVIAWRNKTVDGYNQRIQELRYPSLTMPFAVGEPVIFSSPLHHISSLLDFEQNTMPFDGWNHILCSTESEGVVTKIDPLTDFTYQVDDAVIAIKRYLLTCRLLCAETAEVCCVVTDDKHSLDKLMSKVVNNIKRQSGLIWLNYWMLKSYFSDVRPAYAMTAHKSQGSTFENVFVDAKDILANPNREEALRCLYVAISRASKNVILNI